MSVSTDQVSNKHFSVKRYDKRDWYLGRKGSLLLLSFSPSEIPALRELLDWVEKNK